VVCRLLHTWLIARTCAAFQPLRQSFGVEGPGPCPGLSVNGDPIPFESELFKGVVAVYVRHLPTTPTHLFKGKKRLTWVALQVCYGAWGLSASAIPAGMRCPSASSAAPVVACVHADSPSLLAG
jgi:hypothetical protein